MRYWWQHHTENQTGFNFMVKLWDMTKRDHIVTLYPAFYYLSRS